MTLRRLFHGHRSADSAEAEEPVVSFEIRIGANRQLFQAQFNAPPRRARRKADALPDDCWHPSGAEALVAGRRLDGLVYVGRDLGPADEKSFSVDIEPSLIDPSLPVADASRGTDLDHVWPLSYERLTPGQRASYLDWLAGGREDVDIGAAYIELFVAGLERRAVADHRLSIENIDFNPIVEELRRLLEHYKDHPRSRRVRSLLDVLRAPLLEGRASYIDPPSERAGWETPLELRLGLGALAREGRPLPSEWALSWARCSSDVWLRTPAGRCPTEFADLFALRYQQAHPAGLKLKDLKQRVTIEHYPLNAGLRGPTRYVSALPEIASAGHLVNPLRRLAQSCTDELDGYSRYLGRHQNGEDDLSALALLPAELLRKRESGSLRELREVAEQLDSSEHVLMASEGLMAPVVGPNEKLARKDAIALARVLACLGVGVEPDVRFGGEVPVAGGWVVLFPLTADAAAAPTPEYSVAAALLYVAVAVAAADKLVSPEEKHLLDHHVRETPGLAQDERARLAASLKLLLAQPPSLRRIKARVAKIAGEDRKNIASALLAIAGADGTITPSEVSALTTIFTAMGLDEALLYRQLHSISADTFAGPVIVRAGQPGDAEYALPTAAPEGHVNLDRALINAKLAETATVSALLGEIFAEDEPPALRVEETTGSLGLDAGHSEFLRRLAQRNIWTRAELESTAADLDLLPDGALEIINDVAFESVGAPLWHGDEEIEIDASVLEELIA